MKDKELGIIRSTFLGREDHGIFTFVLHFDFGGSGQGFGTYSLDTPSKDGEGPRRGTVFGLECIMRILEAVGVDSWEKLCGNEMWVFRREGFIRAIKAPSYRSSAGRSFDIQKLAEAYKKEVEK